VKGDYIYLVRRWAVKKGKIGKKDEDIRKCWRMNDGQIGKKSQAVIRLPAHVCGSGGEKKISSSEDWVGDMQNSLSAGGINSGLVICQERKKGTKLMGKKEGCKGSSGHRKFGNQ